WQAWLVGLVALVLVVARRSAFGTALLIAANMALIFAVALSIYAGWLTEERISRTEAWRATTPSERPAGFAGLRWARNYLEELVLGIPGRPGPARTAFVRPARSWWRSRSQLDVLRWRIAAVAAAHTDGGSAVVKMKPGAYERTASVMSRFAAM